ncbi:exodeoxyribonuclease VII small subunit [Anaerobacterium chartisolvens]|uniref:Exodeoxyribonuclease 7 small subunit n=1 Tax=Anaerobacterium chartisolvens TaxID=1297424 RepID=A0A369B5N8_9FIRM|nr:exodeoxyribonuclease VII small subunit [Anaerobacterium chartisolvens]RCX16803.1 exodeoxyribonuclease VII small subunit [Anaerobacterium chartisolvens]
MNKKELAFEEAVNELENIVAKLEKGELPLDGSIEIFQRGIELSRYCGKTLDSMEKKISILLEDGSGEIREELFDSPEA